MNIHPLIVHFPIALLAVYSLLECVPKVRASEWARGSKRIFLFMGVVTAFLALVSGGLAEELVESSPRAYILTVHAPAAGLTTLLYLVLAASYLVQIFDHRGWGDRIAGESRVLRTLWNMKKRLAHLVRDTWVTPVIAGFALFGLLVTGALGAALVYGPEVDPFVSTIYHFFWVY